MHAPQMKFLKDYIESFGGKVPPLGGSAKAAPSSDAKGPSNVEQEDSDDDMPPLEEIGTTIKNKGLVRGKRARRDLRFEKQRAGQEGKNPTQGLGFWG